MKGSTHVRILPVPCLLWSHPLQRGTLLGSAVLDLFLLISNSHLFPSSDLELCRTVTSIVSPALGLSASAILSALPYGSMRSSTFHLAAL